MKPFADDSASIAVGDLVIENGTTAISISGGIVITRDEEGLRYARAIKQIANCLVEELESVGNLPDKIEVNTTPPEKIENPFT